MDPNNLFKLWFERDLGKFHQVRGQPRKQPIPFGAALFLLRMFPIAFTLRQP